MRVATKDVTQKFANKYLIYDYNTGYLHRKYKYANNVIAGKRACRLCNNVVGDHLDVCLFGHNFPAHRIIWLMVYGNFPINHIDHIDHNEHNNLLNNLREVTQFENNRNCSKRCDNTSGVVGVWINKNNTFKKFMAEIQDINSKKLCKSFYSMEEAINQRLIWEKEFEYHSNHGIIKP